MDSEYYEVHYISPSKIIISGYDIDSNNVEVTLTATQKRLYEDFDTAQRHEAKKFIRKLLSED